MRCRAEAHMEWLKKQKVRMKLEMGCNVEVCVDLFSRMLLENRFALSVSFHGHLVHSVHWPNEDPKVFFLFHSVCEIWFWQFFNFEIKYLESFQSFILSKDLVDSAEAPLADFPVSN